MRKRRQAVRAASAKTSPRRKLSWLSSPAEMGCCSATRSISFCSAGANFIEVWLRSWRRAGEMRARATSIASADVPEIRPRTRSGLREVGTLEERFHHRGRGEHREETKPEGKKTTRRREDARGFAGQIL